MRLITSPLWVYFFLDFLQIGVLINEIMLQERLHDELEDVFGNSDRICCRQDLEQLSFLELCLKESLRLYPSVPYFDRYTINTVQIGKAFCFLFSKIN